MTKLSPLMLFSAASMDSSRIEHAGTTAGQPCSPRLEPRWRRKQFYLSGIALAATVMSCSLSSVGENVMQACCMHVLCIVRREPWWCRCAFSQDTGNPDVHARRALAMQVCTVRRALTIQACMLAEHVQSTSVHARRAMAMQARMPTERRRSEWVCLKSILLVRMSWDQLRWR